MNTHCHNNFDYYEIKRSLKVKALVFALSTIITMSITQFSSCMELPPVQEPKLSLEERVANLEQISIRLHQITAKCCEKYTPEYIITMAMRGFLGRLATIRISSDELEANVKQFTQDALDIEQRLNRGAISLNDARYIISQDILLLDYAICAEIRKKYPTQVQIDKFFASLGELTVPEIKRELSSQLSYLHIRSLWDENLGFTCIATPPA
jgi:hypothetical protein